MKTRTLILASLAVLIVAVVAYLLRPAPEPEVAQADLPVKPSPVPSAVLGEGEGEGEKADPKKLTPGFVRVAAGRFWMGSAPTDPGRLEDEEPHEVRLTRAFEMQATEVTQAEYEALMGENPSLHQGCEQCPVEQVSWIDAARYCNKLSRRRGFSVCYRIKGGKDVLWEGPDCEGYRLPTEAEWEYACRAGTTSARYAAELSKVGWTDANSGLRSHPVGQLEPNAWGLYDMLGNVFEWTWDRMDAYGTDPRTDPMGGEPRTGVDNKVFRGGSYKYPPEEARAAFRNAYGAGNEVAWIGFRPVRSLQTTGGGLRKLGDSPGAPAEAPAPSPAAGATGDE